MAEKTRMEAGDKGQGRWSCRKRITGYVQCEIKVTNMRLNDQSGDLDVEELHF